MKVFFLHEKVEDRAQLRHFGGKARNLHELASQGFQVPPGFVVVAPDDFHSYDEEVQKIGGHPVAVRSSGSLEDLPGASFAGLYETILWVQNMEELKAAIKKCFESKNSMRVKDYLEQKKISWTEQDLTMSVLIQRMVDADIAGVLFTMNPLNGFEEECYIEYCAGTGERLVSGHVTPSRIRFNWIEGKATLHEINQEGTTLREDLLKKLISASLEIQAHYGRPQDIEWAVDKSGELHILQSRPVTSYLIRSDRPELTNADLKDGGVSARVCTPTMMSAYRDAMQVSMTDYFHKIKLISARRPVVWAHPAYGRLYWNAGAVKEGLKRLPGFMEDDFDRDLGIQKDYGALGPHVTKLSFSSLLVAIPVLISLYREFEDCLRMTESFKTSFEREDEVFKSKLRDLPSLNQKEFSDWLLRVIDFHQEIERCYYRTIYNNSNYQTEFKTFLKRLPNYRDLDEVELMGELQTIAHLDVQRDLATLKAASQEGMNSVAYLQAREQFLKRHYHHGPAELDIVVPRWGENVRWVDELVVAFEEAPPVRERKFPVTVARLEKGLGLLKRRKFQKMLKRSREFLSVREEMRTLSTRGYYLLRLGCLELGRRLSLRENQIFMFEIEELRTVLKKGKDFVPDLAPRELLYQGYRHFKAPNEFGGKIEAQRPTSQGDLVGLGCSSGEFVGKARIILNIHDAHDLKKDEILVTLFTDPGWTPVLARVGGVITEVGGLLSHAAVIGREYGIPAILNLIDATKLIREGDMIRMNGKTGVVEILKRE